MTTNPIPERSVIRVEFAALLTAQMTGVGKVVQEVFNYSPEDFGGKSPVQTLESAGTERVLLDGVSLSYPNYLITLWHFVLYAEVDEDGKLIRDPLTLEPTWDESDSEETLDLMESQLRHLVDNAQPGASWDSIEFAGPTTVGIGPVGDQSYRWERIPLRFKTM